jgi:hypothetical protein
MNTTHGDSTNAPVDGNEPPAVLAAAASTTFPAMKEYHQLQKKTVSDSTNGENSKPFYTQPNPTETIIMSHAFHYLSLGVTSHFSCGQYIHSTRTTWSVINTTLVYNTI